MAESTTNLSRIPGLSKSRFLSGLQCHKRLYLECFERNLAQAPSPSLQAILDSGTRVGEVARGRFPGGVLVEGGPFEFSQALEKTRALLADSSIPAFFEPAFVADGVKVRVDILARTRDGAFDLIEVKSTTGAKPVHEPDLGIQLHVLEACGLTVRRACLMHLNTGYVYQGGDCDLEQLFTLADLTDVVRRSQAEIPIQLRAMQEAISQGTPPDIQTGDQCFEPYECPFHDLCHTDAHDYPINELPRLPATLRERLCADGIEEIADIPKDYPGLSDLFRRICHCVCTLTPYFSPNLRDELAKLGFPIHFLDFETFNPALPLYPGTRPYETIPFQWSDHVLQTNGSLAHREFLHTTPDDPRPPLAESLIETLGHAGSIVVYSPFEAARLKEVVRACPQYANRIQLVLSRIFDLLPVIRNHCYHPDFHGSFSIKSVLPALVPDASYGDLEIQDGPSASAAYAQLIDPETAPDKKEAIRRSLLNYCGRDTEGMVWLLDALRKAQAPKRASREANDGSHEPEVVI